jgi:hypothetical protein
VRDLDFYDKLPRFDPVSARVKVDGMINKNLNIIETSRLSLSRHGITRGEKALPPDESLPHKASSLFLALGSIHGQRVHKSTGDGDTGTNDRSCTHWCLEGDDRSNDDNNTLDGVSDSVCDRVDLTKS